MFFEILRNISILLAFCMVYSLLFRSRNPDSFKGRCLLGIIFGLASVLAMLSPTELFPGVRIDSRSVFISLAGLFGGGFPAFIAVSISLVCRLILGGTGMVVGFGIILTSATVGVGYRYLRGRHADGIGNVQFWLFGMVVHLIMVGLLFALPGAVRGEVVRSVSLAVLLIYPFGTVIAGRLLSIYNERSEARKLLLENQNRLQGILQAAPTGIGLLKNRVFEDLNPCVCEMTGYSRDELLGQDVRMLYSSDEEYRRVGFEGDAFLKAGDVGTIETRWVRRDGDLRDVLLSFTSLNPDDPESGVTFNALDMTDRNKAQQALSRSEEKYRNLVESTNDVIWEVDEELIYTYCSPQVESILGYTPEEVVGRSLFDFMTPGDAARVGILIQDLQSRSAPILNLEHTAIRKDGTVVIFEASGVPVQDDAGRPAGFRGVERDVTKRKLAEKALKESLQKLALHVEQTPLAVIGWNTNFEVTEWNPAAEKMFGYTREEALGRYGACILLDDADAEEVTRRWKKLLASEGGIRVPGDHRTKDGRQIACEWYSTPLVDPDGEVIGVASLVMDVTARKEAEAERERFMRAIEQAAEIVVITDVDATIQYVNFAFEQVTGYQRDEVVGKNPRILQSGKQTPAFYQAMWGELTAGRPWQGQLINRKKDGSIYTEEASISPVMDTAGNIVSYVAAKRDVTRELELEDQLRQSQKMESVGQMAGGIAHDFNNLLQVIGGYAELSLMDVGEASPVFSALSEIQNASLRGKKLVSQLLSFSRRQVIKPVDLNLNRVIEDHLKMIRGLIGEHITLECVLAPDLLAIHADQGLIEQIVMNLCVNARDAMPAQNGIITVETRNITIGQEYLDSHPVAAPGPYVLLCVSDNGVGMSSELQAHIFEPFFTTKDVGKGTGLGLSTVFGIAKQHGGHIGVYSEPGHGSTFKVYLPAVSHSVESEAAQPPPMAAQGGTETLLVAEDDEAVLALTKHVLSEAGYSVLSARDGIEAIQVFEQHTDKIDGVVFDVVMPRMNGRQALERLLKQRPDLPHLFASGYSDNAVHTNFIQSRGLRLLNKPFQASELLGMVRDMLDKSS